ncbi:hypothetical protein ACE6H2_027141 [Prunus campanulata]
MTAASAAEHNNPHRVRWYEFILFAIVFCLCIIGMIVLISNGYSELGINSPEFRLHSATMSLPNTSASEFTATWEVTVVAFNPNHKVNISYDSLQATIFYVTDPFEDAVLLATKPVPPPSFLTTKAQTTHRFRVETVSAYVGDEVAREISEGRARGGVTFGLKMLGWYRYTSCNTSPRMFEACYQVEFGFSPGNWTGELTRAGQSIACEHKARSPRFFFL